MRRAFAATLALMIAISGAGAVFAHANLKSADPAPNARLATAPSSFRLTFSEPIEPGFARVDVTDAAGADYAGVPEIDADGFSVSVPVRAEAMANAVYTVTWRVVSASDGHATAGSYPVIIGAAVVSTGGAANSLENPVAPFDAGIRAFNLFTLGLLGGLPLFGLLVWRPFARGLAPTPSAEGRLWLLTWFAWAGAGLAALALLLSAADTLTGSVTIPSVSDTLFATRFGGLWIVRVGLWAAYGAVLMAFGRRDALLAGLALAIFAAHSAYGHAAGAETGAAALMIANFAHLLAMAAWLGGLVALIALIPTLRAAGLGALAARFSLLARVAVGGLIISGAVAAWAHIGTPAGLLTTTYGLALVAKLALFTPALALAAVNLLVTTQRLRAGADVWAGRLRALTLAEILLVGGALIGAGVMTSAAPAVVTLAARVEAQAMASAATTPYFEMAEVGDLMAHLIIEPGIVGENTFTVELYEAVDLAPIDDASLIRLRFTPADGSLAESELRPEAIGGGRYSIAGANLSAPGAWRVRATIQRPGQFDAVVDFYPELPAAAPSAPPSAPQAYESEAPRAFTLVPARGGAAPWLLRADGVLLRPVGDIIATTNALMEVGDVETMATAVVPAGAAGEPADTSAQWAPVLSPAPVRAAYFGLGSVLWVATDDGLFRLADAPAALAAGQPAWQPMGDAPGANHLTSTHGYLFTLGAPAIFRVGEGALENDARTLDPPQAAPSRAVVMLADHTHALLSGADVFRTTSMGLGWAPLSAPEPVKAILPDADDNLLALADSALWLYDPFTESWSQRASIPDAALERPAFFGGATYAIAAGGVVRITRDALIPVEVAGAGPIVDLAAAYPPALWAVDEGGALFRLR